LVMAGGLSGSAATPPNGTDVMPDNNPHSTMPDKAWVFIRIPVFDVVAESINTTIQHS
jgi:hypothetical protein